MKRKKNNNLPDGLWESLDSVENIIKTKLKKDLFPFGNIIKDVYEAGIQVTTLPIKKELGSNYEKTNDLKVCGLLLKRVLTDLRGIWILVSLGYTSQAASIAASHFEMTNAIKFIIGKEENAQAFLSHKQGDLPWKPMKLCQLVVKKEHEEAKIDGRLYSHDEYELLWRALYIQYKWLCKIKHPSIPSLLYGTLSTYTKSGEYVIMALPDSSDHDFPTKIQILTISATNTIEAIASFEKTLKKICDKEHEYYKNFKERTSTICNRINNEHSKLPNFSLAFDVSDSEVYKEFEEYSSRVKKTPPCS